MRFCKNSGDVSRVRFADSAISRPSRSISTVASTFGSALRSPEAHESNTDPDAKLYKKSHGQESHLACLGHALVENRNGLIAAAMATQADGYAEREAALLLL